MKDGIVEARYETIFFTEEVNDFFLCQLAELDFDILGHTKKYVKVLLPVGWFHIRIGKDCDYIMDEKQRTRIISYRKDKTSTILRRFDFTISIEEIDTQDFPKIRGKVTDGGKEIEEYEVTEEEYTELMFISAEKSVSILEQVKIMMGYIISSRYPDWTNPLAYWHD